MYSVSKLGSLVSMIL